MNSDDSRHKAVSQGSEKLATGNTGRLGWLWDIGYVLFTALFFYEIPFKGSVFIARDLLQYFYPLGVSLREAWRGSGSFLWDSGIDRGIPMLARYSPTVFYPSTLLYAAFPADQAMSLAILLHFPIAASSTFRIAQRFTGNVPAAWAGGLAYAFSGYMITMIGGGFYCFGAALLPLGVLALIRLAEGPGIWRAMQLAAVFSLQIFNADPQTLYYEVLVLLPVLLVAHASPLRTIARSAPWAAVAGVLCLCLSMCQLLPTIEFTGLSIRASGVVPVEAEAWSFHPLRLGEMAVPFLYGGFNPEFTFWPTGMLHAQNTNPWAQGVYIGALVLICGIVSLNMADRKSRMALKVWGGTTLFFLLMSFGAWFPLHAFIFKLFPLADKFRYPEKFLVFVTLGMSVLGAVGLGRLFDEVGRPGRGSRSVHRVLAGAGVFCALLLAGRLIFAPESPRSMDLMAGLLHDLHSPIAPAKAIEATASAIERTLLVVLALASILLLRRHLAVRLLPPLLILVLMIDVISAGVQLRLLGDSDLIRDPPAVCDVLARVDPALRPTIWRSPQIAMNRWGLSPETDTLRERRLHVETVLPNLATAYCASYVSGYEAGRLQQFTSLENGMRRERGPSRFMEIMGVDYILSNPGEFDTNLFPVVAKEDAIGMLIQTANGLPYAFGRGRVVSASGIDDAVRKVSTSRFDARNEVVLETARDLTNTGDAPRHVTLVRHVPGKVELNAVFAEPGYLVILESYYPGWRARIDGSEVTIRRANAAFMAVEVPRGDHAIMFTFDPAIQRMANGISLITAAGMLLTAGSCLVLSRRQSPGHTGSRNV